MDFAFVERQAGGFRQRRERSLSVLRRHPDLGPVCREIAVQFIGSMVAWARNGVE